MKKKIIFGALALSSLALILTACKNGGTDTTTGSANTTTSGVVTTTTGTTTTTGGINTTTGGIVTTTGGIVTTTDSATTTSEQVEAKVYYVSPNATASGKGTKEDPMPFHIAYNVVEAGDTIILTAGTYKYNFRQELKVSGQAGKYITMCPENEGDRVIFDFSSMAFNGSNRGIQVYGSFWHIYGIEVTGAGDNGVYVAGDHNIIENCMFYSNRDTGLQLGRAYNTDNTLDSWPSYNLIKNCTSFANFDEDTLGENADGFAAKLTVGYGNVFDGCMAFRNSDDGWDLFAKVDSGNIGTITLYNCVSFENGYMPYTVNRSADGVDFQSYNTLNGDGIGFKLGGSTMMGDVVLNNCLAFDNKLHGFGDNSNPGVISITNCTAFNNCSGLVGMGTKTDQNLDGRISSNRGIDGDVNKSNNFDLARDNKSYNNYYGALSYTNNQSHYSTGANDSLYNVDSYKGAVAYSVFNVGYDGGEVYRSFTTPEDASAYKSETVDTAFTNGSKGSVNITDSDFKDLTSINAICESSADVAELGLAIVKDYRNADGSVNMHDKVALSDNSQFKIFNNGNAIGATLNKTSFKDYDHPDFYTFEATSKDLANDEVSVLSAYASCQPITSSFATYQDFDLPKLVDGCDITWTSSNTDVISIDMNEVTTVSGSFTSKANVIVPEDATNVTLTATINKGAYTTTRDFVIHVLGRNQDLGALTSTGDTAIRVAKYGSYAEPRVYALDSSSVTKSELPQGLYTIEYTYEYATSGGTNASYYKVDGVYTSIPGVYRVTAKGTSLKSNRTSTFVYNVYVVDPDCDIDFYGEIETTLTSTGVQLVGNLSNIEGSVYALVSETNLGTVTYADIINNENAQSVAITTDSIVAKFDADNLNIKDEDGIQYYVYYVVANANKSNTNATVRSFSVSSKSITTNDEFYQLARNGKLSSEAEASSLMIYSLKNDLDFKDYYWDITKTSTLAGFSGLFNGNGHTVSNISITTKDNEGASIDISKNKKVVNVFYQLTGGTIMNLNVNEMSIKDTTSSATQVGFVGEMRGGYLHKIQLTNVSLYAYDSAGALVGKVSGGYNYITECQLINPIPEDYNDTEYVIGVKNKYAAGLVANVQANSDSAVNHLYISDCAVLANIGDGLDGAGNLGGIVGRIKGEDARYVLSIVQCYYYGTIIAKGQYNAGILGDIESGSGAITVLRNYSDAKFVYAGVYLDAWENRTSEQVYAHKNSNPIIGRANVSTGSITSDISNVGTWADYYCVTGNIMVSKSIVFDLTLEDSDTMFEVTQRYCENVFYMDFSETGAWQYDQETGRLSLKALA